MGTTIRYRFRSYTIARDESAAPTYEAVCVTGDDADCGESSGERTSPEEVEKWLMGHLRETGHERCRRTFADYADVHPGAWQ
jgi:hypothetical protein